MRDEGLKGTIGRLKGITRPGDKRLLFSGFRVTLKQSSFSLFIKCLYRTSVFQEFSAFIITKQSGNGEMEV